MKISLIGSRGLPADYGGFETLVDFLVKYLPKEKYQISVSCKYKKDKELDEYKGAQLFYPPFRNPKNEFFKKIYEIFSDFYFTIQLGSHSDIIYLMGGGTGVLFTRLFNQNKTILNIAGLEHMREKYNSFEQSIMKFKLLLEMIFADIIITDAKALQDFFPKYFHKKMVHIAYGADEFQNID